MFLFYFVLFFDCYLYLVVLFLVYGQSINHIIGLGINPFVSDLIPFIFG